MIYVLILQLRHTSNRLTQALVRLILAFCVRLCGKKKRCISGHFVISRCFQNKLFLNFLSTITKFKWQTVWIEIRPDVFVSKVHLVWPYKYCLETTRDLGSRSQVFGHVQNSPPRPFRCVLLVRSLPINKNQRATVFHLIFAFLSCLIVKAPKTLLKTCIHLLLPSTAEPAHQNTQRPLWSLLC